MPAPTTADEYMANLPDGRRAVMLALREAIRNAAPAAQERVAYAMPAFYLEGRFLVSYAAYKEHYSLFPATGRVQALLGDEIAPYLAGKGTIRIPVAEPVPLDLVRRIVAIRMEEVTRTAS